MIPLIFLAAGCSDNSTGIDSNNDDCDIKGNISSSGEKIYHVPGQDFYDVTQIDESNGEEWFCSENEAKDSGWRKSKR